MTTDSRLPADLTTRLSQLASPALPRTTRPGTWRQILLKPDILSGDRLCIGVLYQCPPHPAPYFRLVDPDDYLQLATLYNAAMLDNLRYVHRLVETALTHGDLTPPSLELEYGPEMIGNYPSPASALDDLFPVCVNLLQGHQKLAMQGGALPNADQVRLQQQVLSEFHDHYAALAERVLVQPDQRQHAPPIQTCRQLGDIIELDAGAPDDIERTLMRAALRLLSARGPEQSVALFVVLRTGGVPTPTRRQAEQLLRQTISLLRQQHITIRQADNPHDSATQIAHWVSPC